MTGGQQMHRQQQARAPRRLGLLLAVLLGHALLLLGLWRVVRPAPPLVGAAPARLLVWLRNPAPAAETRHNAPVTAHRSPPPAAPPALPRRQQALVPPTATAADPPVALSAPAGTAVQAAPAPADRPASQPALDLRWRPGASVGASVGANTGAAPAAMDLVRSAGRTAVPDRDQRLGQALGTDTTLQEQDRGTARRFRQGRACVDAHVARDAQINPMGAAAATMPRLLEPC